MVRGGVFALFLAVCATPAAADISAFFASVAFDEAASLDSGPGFGIRWGNSSKMIGGETSLMIARPSRTGSFGDESTTAIFYEGRLMINVPTGTAIAPFVGVGLGAITVLSTDIPTSINDTDDAQAALSAVSDTQTNRPVSYGGGGRYAPPCTPPLHASASRLPLRAGTAASTRRPSPRRTTSSSWKSCR